STTATVTRPATACSPTWPCSCRPRCGGRRCTWGGWAARSSWWCCATPRCPGRSRCSNRRVAKWPRCGSRLATTHRSPAPSASAWSSAPARKVRMPCCSAPTRRCTRPSARVAIAWSLAEAGVQRDRCSCRPALLFVPSRRRSGREEARAPGSAPLCACERVGQRAVGGGRGRPGRAGATTPAARSLALASGGLARRAAAACVAALLSRRGRIVQAPRQRDPFAGDVDLEHLDLDDVAGLDHLARIAARSEEHTSELQSRENLVCRLLLGNKKLYSPP